MHIKFLAHGTGSGGKAGAYLMGTHDHKGELRAGVEVLRGDPQLFASLAEPLLLSLGLLKRHRPRMKLMPLWTTSRSWPLPDWTGRTYT